MSQSRQALYPTNGGLEICGFFWEVCLAFYSSITPARFWQISVNSTWSSSIGSSYISSAFCSASLKVLSIRFRTVFFGLTFCKSFRIASYSLLSVSALLSLMIPSLFAFANELIYSFCYSAPASGCFFYLDLFFSLCSSLLFSCIFYFSLRSLCLRSFDCIIVSVF